MPIPSSARPASDMIVRTSAKSRLITRRQRHQVGDPLHALARNVTTRYLAIATDALIGLVLLPFNVHHLGPAAYGLWMLTASMTTYFSVLDLGFGGSIVRFVAHYRAKRDARGLNEIASTLFVIFSVLGLVAYAMFVLVALNIGRFFALTPDQVSTGRSLMLIIGVYVSLGFPFSIFGGVINGFQRYDLNNVVGVGSSVIIALINVVMLLAGCTLVQLVAVTTLADRHLPGLPPERLQGVPGAVAQAEAVPLVARARAHRLQRLRLDHRLGQQAELLDRRDHHRRLHRRAAVALWTVPQRLAEMMQRLTNQFNGVIFPVDRRQRRRPAAGAPADDLHPGDAVVAGDGASRSPRRCSCSPGR